MSELSILAGSAMAIALLLGCLTGLAIYVVVRFHRITSRVARILAMGEHLAGEAHGMAATLIADAATMRRSVHQLFDRLGNGTGSGSRRHARRQNQKGGES